MALNRIAVGLCGGPSNVYTGNVLILFDGRRAPSTTISSQTDINPAENAGPARERGDRAHVGRLRLRHRGGQLRAVNSQITKVAWKAGPSEFQASGTYNSSNIA